MTPEQRRLYLGMLRLGRTFGKGPTSTGVRADAEGLAAPTYEALPAATGYFLENNRVAERSSLPAIPIYTAPWWWITGVDTDIEAGDIRTDGTNAFIVTGVPDTSQGFQVAPAAVYPLAEVPTVITPAGYGAPLWLLGVGSIEGFTGGGFGSALPFVGLSA